MLTNNKISLDDRTDLTETQQKMWRTLIRVESLDQNQVGFVLPAWNSDETIYFNLHQLRQDLRENIKLNYRFHAEANIGVNNPEDIYIDLNSYENQ